MCPTGIVLTDSPYDSATDTLAEKRVQKYEKSQKWCFLRMEKNPQPKAFARVADYLLYNYNYKTNFFVILQCRYLLVLFNGLRRNRMKRRKNVKKESRLFI